MSDYNAAQVRVFCRDCGQPLAVIQQEEVDGSYLIQVTCWQSHCLLRGFTFSLDHYKLLNHAQLEAYRQMNRIYPPQYVRVDSY
jgi:hypothetical protein